MCQQWLFIRTIRQWNPDLNNLSGLLYGNEDINGVEFTRRTLSAVELNLGEMREVGLYIYSYDLVSSRLVGV